MDVSGLLKGVFLELCKKQMSSGNLQEVLAEFRSQICQNQKTERNGRFLVKIKKISAGFFLNCYGRILV